MKGQRNVSRARKSRQPKRPRRFWRPVLETLEDRRLLAFSVVGSDVYSTGGFRLVADFNQPVNAATVQAADLVLDGSVTATGVNVVDADTVEFLLPSLAAGTHAATIASGTIQDSQGASVDPFSNSFAVASAAQYTVKHNPRLQPGNAPLVGFAGGDLDRVDVLWQTISGGTGTQDSFTVDYRASGATTWQTATLNSTINTGVEGRVIWSASITGLNWNADYEYRVRHRRADVIAGEYQSTYRTRLAAGDTSSFTFAAYGDSASGSATGFRQVQSRINQINPKFSVLLGDNVYSSGTHQESDARFDPTVNPEAAAWMAGHIDYLGLGNHDVVTSSGLPAEQNYSVPVPVAGVTAPVAPPATERPEHSFSWDYGNAHFVTFDTNSYTDTTRLDGLLNWVVADLAASTARWKIVYGHHPLAGVPDKPENPGGNYYQQVVNRLKAAGVDLFMTGHSHTYSWTYPLTGQINGTATYADHGADDYFHAGEGLPQLVSGVGGVEVRTGDYSQFPFVAEGFTSATAVPARLGFSKIDVTPNTLTVSYVAADNGAVIDSFVVEKEATQATSFQQGVNGYTGTVDTFLHQNTPTTNNAAATSLKVDNDDPASTGLDAQTLLRFDNLFGSGAGQIPTNVTLRTATLQLNVTNGSTNNMNLHRMLTSWSASDTWNSRTNGIQTDGVEAVALPDTSSGSSQVGTLSFNVLASLQAWQSNPATNLGWAFIPTGTDGIDFNSSEGTVKPKLIVTWVESGPNSPPVANADSATTNGNTPVTIAVLANDTDPNGDTLTVQSTTTPAHGSVVVNANQSVTYTPVSGYYGSDSFSYTASDGRGGTSSATVSLTVAQTVVFQQGLNGYAAAVDTFLQQNTPGANNGAATSLNIDGDDPVGTGLDVQTLLRFDNLFGSGTGQIPANATLQSATLQVQVTNSGNAINLHRMLAPWSASDTWTSLTGGVTNDGVEAVAAADVSTATIATGLLSINVLPSLQAWLANPSSNRGWVMLPTGSDGVDFDSSEGTTRPKLTVIYVPAPNNPPTAVNDTATTNEDTPLAIPVLANDSDSDGGTLTVTAVTSGTLGTTAIDPGGTVTYTPNANVSGNDSFTYTISDGQGGSATATVAVTVNPVNDAPIAGNDTGNTAGATPVAISVLSNDTDMENSALTVVLASSPANGSAVLNANGTVTYTANANFSGTDSFTYRASDGDATSNLATVTVTVAAVPKFFVVDNAADKTFRYSAAGGYLSQASLATGNTNSRGVATNVDGSQFWVLDSNKVVYVYNANQTLLGSWTASGLKTPTGIAVSGNDVWISDSGNDRVYRHVGGASRLSGTFAATSSFALATANNNSQDLATDGTTIWVTQSGSTDRVFVYSVAGASLGNWTLPAANTSPVGITIDPTGASQSLWIVDDSTDRVYEYASARSRLSGTQAALVTFALNTSNGSAQGIADPRALTARDGLFASESFAAATSVSLTTEFQSLRSTAIWPVSGTTFNEIESTFGPRIKASTNGYDWHRGIDIDAAEGTPVLAPVAGTLFDIKTYTDGGLTVILKHTFPDPVLFAGKTLTSFYTYYMHLSSVDPTLQTAADAGQTPVVPQGFQIGRVGHSGTAIGDHLHWEIRVGTPYSLEWQLANPTSQYGSNNFGFDPHVHPLLLAVPTATNTLTASLTTTPTNKVNGRVRITTDDEQPLFNRVQVKIVKKSTNLTVADHLLDLNERLGFNATTNALLDTPDVTKPYFAPISFGTSAAAWSTDLVIPKSWVGSNYGSKFQTIVTVTDIWGRTKTISW